MSSSRAKGLNKHTCTAFVRFTSIPKITGSRDKFLTCIEKGLIRMPSGTYES